MHGFGLWEESWDKILKLWSKHHIQLRPENVLILHQSSYYILRFTPVCDRLLPLNDITRRRQKEHKRWDKVQMQSLAVNLLPCARSVFPAESVSFQDDLGGVITVFMNVIILAFMLAFLLSHIKRRRVICLSSYLFHCPPPPPPQRKTSEEMQISAIFPPLVSSAIPPSQGRGTTMLVINFLIPFISLSPPPPLPPCARCHPLLPACLSLTICLFSASSVFPLSCRQLVSSANPQPTFILLYPNTPTYICCLLLRRRGSCYTRQRGCLIFTRSEQRQKAFDRRTRRHYHLNQNRDSIRKKRPPKPLLDCL